MGWPQNAYVGQKVVCVEDGVCGCGCGTPLPPLDCVYTISRVEWFGDWGVAVDLIEYPAPAVAEHFPYWQATMFRPVQSTETGMAILRQAMQPNCKVRETEDA